MSVILLPRLDVENVFDELSIISQERSSSEIIDSESNKSSYPIETTKSQS